MKSIIFRKSIIVFIIVAPLLFDFGCKKQPKCGCGKDVLFTLDDGSANVYFSEETRSAYFTATTSYGSMYYICSPGRWVDSLALKNFSSGQSLLVSGKVYYDCTYLMNSSNYAYGQIPPVYQVEVTSIKEDNYGKK
jgi:hypothetical protein